MYSFFYTIQCNILRIASRYYFSIHHSVSVFVAIGSAVPAKKIFEGFLPYMGMVAILVMRPGLFIIGPPFIQMLPIKFDFD